MKKFKTGDHVQDIEHLHEKAIVVDPSLHTSPIAEESIVVRIGDSDYLYVWKESETKYDTEWLRKQNLNKLI